MPFLSRPATRISPLSLALGVSGAAVFGLLAAYVGNDAEVAFINRLVAHPVAPRDLIEGATPTDAIRIYLAALGTVFGVVIAFAALLHVLAARAPRPARLLGPLISLAAVIAAAIYAPFAGVIAFGAVALLVPSLRGAAMPAREEGRDRVLLAAVLAGECAAFGWGVWLTTSSRGPATVLGSALAVTVLVALRLHAVATSRSPRKSASLEARAFTPMALAPLLGLLRAPSPAALGVLLLVCLALRTLPRARRLLVRLPLEVSIVAVAWAAIAMLDTPLRLRDLANLNFDGHEAGQYGWVNSAFHGKMLMAEASTVYGPLREYCLAAFLLLFGKTALQLRVAQVVMNLLGVASVLPVLWRVARRSLVLFALGGYLMVVGTHIFVFLDYAHSYSFGWGDFARTAFPTAIAFGGVAAILDAAARPSSRPTWPFVVGALSGLTVFYVQELGPLACVTVVLGVLAHGALAPNGAPVARSVARAARACVPYAGGVAVGIALFLLPYVATGKLGRLFHTLFFTALLFNAGHGTLPFPIGHGDFLHWSSLTAEAGAGALRLEYILCPMVYLAAGVCLLAPAFLRSWTGRHSALFSLLVFGIVSFRVAMGRADSVHLMSVTLPAILLFTDLVANACDALAPALRLAPLQVRGLAAAGCVLLSSSATGFTHGLVPKVVGILDGDEKPSSGDPYTYPGIPRAGDLKLSSTVVQIVNAVQARTSPGDAIYYRGMQTFGAEFYFLTDRRNVTRFDLPHEMFTRSLQHEAFLDFVGDPPKILITQDARLESPEIRAFFDSNYRSVANIDGVSIDQYVGVR